MRKKNRFIVACNGLWFVFKNEVHFKIHIIVFILVVLLGLYFRIEKWEWAIVLLCSLLIFICEIINTAMERLCDYIQPGNDERIGLIKDIAASAVFVSAVIVSVIGIILFLPHIIKEVHCLV